MNKYKSLFYIFHNNIMVSSSIFGFHINIQIFTSAEELVNISINIIGGKKIEKKNPSNNSFYVLHETL